MGPIKCALEMAAVNLITRSNSGLNSGKGGARDWCSVIRRPAQRFSQSERVEMKNLEVSSYQLQKSILQNYS